MTTTQQRLTLPYMPGSFGNYMNTLDTTLAHVAAAGPTREELNTWIPERFGVSRTPASETVAPFLIHMGLAVQTDRLALTDFGRERLLDRDDEAMVRRLDRVYFFVVDMLREVARRPMDERQLAEAATATGAVRWNNPGPINTRRGWLESAGLVYRAPRGLIEATEAGRAFLGRFDAGEWPVCVEPVEAAAVSVPVEAERPGSPLSEVRAPRVAALRHDDEALLDDLRVIAEMYDTTRPTGEMIDSFARVTGAQLAGGRRGRGSATKQTYIKRFGSLVEARRRAGLDPGAHAGPGRTWDEAGCLDAVMRAWADLGCAPTGADYEVWACGRQDAPSLATVRNRWGCWSTVTHAALGARMRGGGE